MTQEAEVDSVFKLPKSFPSFPGQTTPTSFPSRPGLLAELKLPVCWGSQGLLECCFGQGGEIKKLPAWRSGTSYCSLGEVR